jgi:hypothetical protein
MSIEIQKPGNPWLDYGYAATARSIVGTLLKFNKGEFFAGVENRPIPIGTEMVPLMASLTVGWVRWQSDAPTDRRMGLVVDRFVPAKRSDLGDTDQTLWEPDAEGDPQDPWQLTNYLPMCAKRDSEPFTFTTTSRGGLSAIGDLCKTYGKHMGQFPDQLPVIKLEVGSYLHRQKSIGRIKFPIFTLVSWTDKGPYLDLIGNSTPPTGPTNTAPLF